MLKQQLALLLEHNMFFKLIIKLTVITAKCILNLLIFLLAAKNYNEYATDVTGDETWAHTITYLNSLLKESTIGLRLTVKDEHPSPVKSITPITATFTTNQTFSKKPRNNNNNNSIDDTLCSDSGYLSKCETDSFLESSMCFNNNPSSTALTSFKELNLAQFRLQSTAANTKISRQKTLIKRLRSYYRTNLFKVQSGLFFLIGRVSVKVVLRIKPS
jgi:hypothetical protein